MRTSSPKITALFLCLFLFSFSCFQALHPSKIDRLTSAQFNVYHTSDTIRLQNFTVPFNTAFKFLLLTHELSGIDESVILKKILDANDGSYSRSITLYHDNEGSLTFSDLKSGQTYYLYFIEFSGTERRQAGPYLKIVKTSHSLMSPLAFVEEYASTWMSFILPIAALMLSAFCISRIEKRSMKSKNENLEKARNERIRSEQHFHKHDYKLREHAIVYQENILSAKQNAREKTNISGWQERNEIERIIRRLEEDNKEFEDRLICEICCERFREVIFLSCGHVYCCEKCAMELVTCPIDKSVICSKYRYNMCDKYGINNQLLPQIIASRLQHLDIYKSTDLNTQIAKRDGSLIEKYLMLKLKNENYKMFYNCIICNERKKNVLFLHCRHLICCDRCAENLKVCPLDGLHIIKKTHVFTA